VWYSLPLRKVHTNIMMGPAHSLSGAAVWLGGSAAYTIITGTEIPPAILIMGTAVFAGAALVPDLDSYSATATKSFGIFGRLLYYIVNSLSMLIHGATRTKYDKPVENGHRTFMHTTVGAALLGVLTLVLTSLPGHTEIFGKQFATGQLFAIGIMFSWTILQANQKSKESIRSIPSYACELSYHSSNSSVPPNSSCRLSMACYCCCSRSLHSYSG
jgi:membrane-bound metal-dependent hydrolase YbcI (DUF457 family)